MIDYIHRARKAKNQGTRRRKAVRKVPNQLYRIVRSHSPIHSSIVPPPPPPLPPKQPHFKDQASKQRFPRTRRGPAPWETTPERGTCHGVGIPRTLDRACRSRVPSATLVHGTVQHCTTHRVPGYLPGTCAVQSNNGHRGMWLHNVHPFHATGRERAKRNNNKRDSDHEGKEWFGRRDTRCRTVWRRS